MDNIIPNQRYTIVGALTRGWPALRLQEGQRISPQSSFRPFPQRIIAFSARAPLSRRRLRIRWRGVRGLMRIRECGRRGCRHYQVNLRLAFELERNDATAVDNEF